MQGKKKKQIVIGAIIVCVLLVGAGIAAWFFFGEGHRQNTGDTSNTPAVEAEGSGSEEEGSQPADNEGSQTASGDIDIDSLTYDDIDWDSTYYVYDEEVVSQTPVASSTNTLAVKDLTAELEARGFDAFMISADYDMEGSYLGEKSLLAVTEYELSSTDEYPLYSVYYESPSGNLWVLYVCDGDFMANPFFMYEFGAAQILLTEHDYTTSYSAHENTFIRSVVSENDVDMKRVDKITADLLDSLDEAGVNAL